MWKHECVNHNTPILTEEEAYIKKKERALAYYYKHKDAIKERHNLYYQENRQILNQKRLAKLRVEREIKKNNVTI